MTWITIGPTTPAEWVNWLMDNVGLIGIDWKWNDDSCGHYFLCFRLPEDAVAFKLKFGLS